MADDRVDIDIHADDNASAPLRTVIKSLDDLGDTAVKQSAKIRTLERSLSEVKDEARDLAARMKLAERSIQKMGNEALKSAAKIQALELALKNLGGAGAGMGGRGGKVPGGFFGGIVNGGRKLRGFLMFMLIPVIGDAVGAIATLGGALGAMGAAAIGALGPLTGLAAIVPGALAAIVSGAGAAVVGLMGVKDAVSTLLDPDATVEELDAAMENLTKPGRRLARVLASMKKPAQDLQREVQQALAPGLTNLAKTVRDAIPWFQELFDRSAGRVGLVARDFSSLLQQTRVQEQIAQIMLNNTDLISTFGRTGISLFRALLNIMVAAGPLLQRLADDLADWSERLADVTERNGPAMIEFFEKTYDVTKDLIKFTADLSMALYNVFKIGAELGGEMGDSFLDMTERFRDFTESVEGQKSIKNWFDTMKPVIYEVGRLFADMGKGLGELSMDGTLVGTLQVIRTELLPALMDFLRATSGKFLPLVANILAAIAKVFTEIEFFPLTLKIIADIFDTIASVVELLPDPLKKALGFIIGIAAVLKFASFVGIFRFMGAAAGGAAGKVGILSKATGLLGKAAAMGPQIVLAAVAAIGIEAWNSARQIDEMTDATKDLANELLTTSSLDALDRMKTQIEDIREALRSARGLGEEGEASFFSTDVWVNADTYGNAFRMVGHSLKTLANMNVQDIFNPQAWKDAWGEGPEWAHERYQAMLDEATAAQRKYYQDMNKIANEIFPDGRVLGVDFSYAEGSDQLQIVQKIADTLGIDLTQGYDKARDAIVGYYNAVYAATPASAEFYQSLLVLQDEAATAADKVSAFESALKSLRDSMTSGGLADAQVDAAKGFKDFGDAFEDSIVKMKNGQVVFKAAAEENWNLHGALRAQAGAIENVAIATMQQTGNVTEAVSAYTTEYDKLVRKTVQGLRDQGMGAADAKIAAEQLVAQYALTPDVIQTIFEVNPQGIQTLLESGIQIQDILAYLNGTPLSPTVDAAALSLIQSTLGQPVNMPVTPTVVPSAIQGPLIPGQQYPGGPVNVPVTPTVDTSGISTANTEVTTLQTNLNAVGTTVVTPTVPNSGMTAAERTVSDIRTDLINMPTYKKITIEYDVKGEPRAMGGPVASGNIYTVGEVGPEMFVSNSGLKTMIGMNGPELRSFPSDGYVIPNHALVKEGMTAEQMHALSSAVAGRTAKAPLSGEYREARQAVVNIGTINAKSDIDIVQAVKKGIAEAERNRRERS